MTGKGGPLIYILTVTSKTFSFMYMKHGILQRQCTYNVFISRPKTIRVSCAFNSSYTTREYPFLEEKLFLLFSYRSSLMVK
jgi:hypothetical protein